MSTCYDNGYLILNVYPFLFLTACVTLYLSWHIYFLFLICPFPPPCIPLHPSLPVPSEGACWGWQLSQNKHTTPDSISPGQHLRTNFLLIDLHPSHLSVQFSSLFTLPFCIAASSLPSISSKCYTFHFFVFLVSIQFLLTSSPCFVFSLNLLFLTISILPSPFSTLFFLL